MSETPVRVRSTEDLHFVYYLGVISPRRVLLRPVRRMPNTIGHSRDDETNFTDEFVGILAMGN